MREEETEPGDLDFKLKALKSMSISRFMGIFKNGVSDRNQRDPRLISIGWLLTVIGGCIVPTIGSVVTTYIQVQRNTDKLGDLIIGQAAMKNTLSEEINALRESIKDTQDGDHKRNLRLQALEICAASISGNYACRAAGGGARKVRDDD